MAANSGGVSAQYKLDLLTGAANYNLGGATGTLKMALFQPNYSITPGIATYTAAAATGGECAQAGGYTTGGAQVPTATPSIAAGTFAAIWTPGGNVVWTNVNVSFDAIALYHVSTLRMIEVFKMASTQSVTGDLTLGMPANDVNNALMRFN